MMIIVLQVLFVALTIVGCLLAHTLASVRAWPLIAYVAGLSLIGSGFWLLFVGEPIQESQRRIRQFVYAHFLTEKCRLGFACAVLSLVCVFLYVLLVRRQTVIFLTAEDSEVEVHWHRNGGPELLGRTSKSTPLREPFSAGKQKFTFKAKAPGFDETKAPEVIEINDSIDTQGQWISVPPERHLFINLPGRPDFLVQDPAFDSHVKSSEFAQRPTQGPLLNDPKAQPTDVFTSLTFGLRTSSSGPMQVSDFHLKVLKPTRTKDWTFPYCGEADAGIAASIDRGYAVLQPRPERYPIQDLTQTHVLGKGLPVSLFGISVIAEAGWSYELALEFRWIDLNNPSRTNRIDRRLPALNAPKLWQGLGRKQRLRILYNARVDVLQGYLNNQATPLAYTILVADTKADAYFQENNLEASTNMAALSRKALTEFEQKQLLPVLSSKGVPRPCNFIAFDDKTVLIQKPDSPARAELLVDPREVSALIAEYDRLATIFLKK